jgi:AcrR family transcriptional regulator
MSTRRRGRPALDDVTTHSDDELLDRALVAFADHGFEGTSVRELARELGVSHNLIPQRFGSKERLWYLAVDRGFGHLAAEMADLADEPDPDPVAALRAQVARFVSVNATRPSLLRIINQEAAAPGPRLDHLFTTYIEPVRAFGEQMLTELFDAGLVRTRSVALVYFLMTHGAGGPLSLGGLAERFGESVDPDDQAAVQRYTDEAVEVLFEGLLRNN